MRQDNDPLLGHGLVQRPVETQIPSMTTDTFKPLTSTFELPANVAPSLRYLVPVGRALFALPLAFMSLGHFSSDTIGYAAASGVPAAGFFVPASGVLLLFGALSILLGWKTRLGALAVAMFLVPVTLKMHAFWAIEDAQAAMMQQISFLKNVAMLGGAALLGYFGAGPVSLDARSATTRTRI